MKRWRGIAVWTVSGLLLPGCGSGPSPATFRGDPAAYVLGIDDLRDAGFSLLEGPTRLTTPSAEAGVRVRFFRTVNAIALSNGPIDVSASVFRFADPPAASAALSTETRSMGTSAGEEAISTGPLGDEAHATQMTATDSGGTRLVQFTLRWRIGNLVDELVVRGRFGGTRITDALALANRMVDNELGVITPPARRSQGAG